MARLCGPGRPSVLGIQRGGEEVVPGRDFLDALGPMGHLLRTVLDICPDVFAWFADMDDRLMFVNRLNVQMCNFHTEFDAIGKTCANLSFE